jgi:molybdate transport system substrate-binding protein
MINVISSLAIREAYLELVPQFERQCGQQVSTTWLGSSDIVKRMRAGPQEDAVDLVIMAAAAIDELAKEGHVVQGSRVDLVSSKIGVAVRAGAPRPDLGSGEALKRALLAAKSVGYSSGPSGVYLSGVLERWGIPKSKIMQTPPGTPVGDLISRGEVEIGFQQVSELLPVKGIDYAGLLPADIQLVTVFSAGTHRGAKQAEAAKAWTRFLTSPAAAPVIRKNGLEPA